MMEDHNGYNEQFHNYLFKPSNTLKYQTFTQQSNSTAENNKQKTEVKNNISKVTKIKNTSPHDRKPASRYNNWKHSDMLKAMQSVKMKELSMTASAKKYGIPRTTLRHYLNDGTSKDTRNHSFTLTKEKEKELVHSILSSEGNERELYQKLVTQAENIHKSVDKGINEKQRQTPTQAWIRRFIFRHKRLHSYFPSYIQKQDHFAKLDPKDASSTEIEDDFESNNDYNYKDVITNRKQRTSTNIQNGSLFNRGFRYYSKETDYYYYPMFQQNYLDYKHSSNSPEMPIHNSESTQVPSQRDTYSLDHKLLAKASHKRLHSDSDLYNKYSKVSLGCTNAQHASVTKNFFDDASCKQTSFKFQCLYGDTKHTQSFHESAEFCNTDSETLTKSFDQKREHRNIKPETLKSSTNSCNTSQMLDKHFTVIRKDEIESTINFLENQVGRRRLELFKERYSSNPSLEILYSKWVILKTNKKNSET